MKKLTDIIKENTGTNIYSYKVKLDISGLVHAENEGSAGEEVDKEMDVILGAISDTGIGASCDTYNIEDIELSLDSNKLESIDNNKILESLDADRQGELITLASDMVKSIEDEARFFVLEEKNFLIDHIKKNLDKLISEYDEPVTHQPKYSVGTEINQELSDILNAAVTNYDDYVNKLKAFNSKYDLSLTPLHKAHVGQSQFFNWEDGEELTPQEIQLRWDAMLNPDEDNDQDDNTDPNTGDYPFGSPRSNY